MHDSAFSELEPLIDLSMTLNENSVHLNAHWITLIIIPSRKDPQKKILVFLDFNLIPVYVLKKLIRRKPNIDKCGDL